jgi:hypothetical protein
MTRLVVARKTRRFTEEGGPIPHTRSPGAKVHREKEFLNALAGICKRRRRKLLSIRRQLVADRYNMDMRLDAVLEKILQSVID